MEALIEIHYLPSIAWFSAVAGANTIVLERHEHFVKQTCRNRCYINTEHGRDMLSVPLTSPHHKVSIADVRIDYSQKWLNHHWRTIRSAYGKAPFFEYYSDDFREALFRSHTFLYDLNLDLLTLCLRWLRWEVSVRETLSYEKNPAADILDLRSVLTSRNPANISDMYKAVPYYQVFGSAFVDNLSLLDLIFCSGPEAGRIVQASRATG